jgi:hypothetical protein
VVGSGGLVAVKVDCHPPTNNCLHLSLEQITDHAESLTYHKQAEDISSITNDTRIYQGYAVALK